MRLEGNQFNKSRNAITGIEHIVCHNREFDEINLHRTLVFYPSLT